MILTTTDSIPDGSVTQILGVVKGSCVRAKHIGKDIRGIGRAIIGGEMTYYSDLLNESRDTAITRMVEEAERWDADAIINIRLQTSMVIQGAAEVLAYGTAVKVHTPLSQK